MRNSLLFKLILAFLVIAITTAALMALFIRITSAERLTSLILDQQRNNMQTSLAEYYAAKGSWDGVKDEWQQIRIRSIPTPPSPDPNHQPPPNDKLPSRHDRWQFFGLADMQGNIIVPIDPDYPIGVSVSKDILTAGTPVTVNGLSVGTILTANQKPYLNPEESLFLERTNQALLYAVLGAMAVALLIGFVLARTLIRPIQALTLAAQNIAQGDLEQEVDVHSNDELGKLAASFNRMSQEVARVNLQRKQMTADIAHDLRTPLTVIAGYIESMMDGILQPTPERLSLIYTEIERLQNLVGDLKMLSQVDAGELSLHPQPISPKVLLERAASPFSHRAQQQEITISVLADENLPDVSVDEARMMQVFGNLITNSLRYTNAGGKITLTASIIETKIRLSIIDTGSGISAKELPFIFDRFHRADESRYAEEGETGLGLAIVKALVESHAGIVSAESILGNGTSIHIMLPLK